MSRISLRPLWILAALVFLAAGCSSKQPTVPNAAPVVPGDKVVKTQAVPVKDTPVDQDKAQTGKKTPPYVGPKVETGPKLQLSQQGVTLRWIENGSTRMSATAKEFKGNEITRVGELLHFSAQLYENGKLKATITAPKAVADTVNRVVTATGGVTLKSLERNTTVRASWMKWYAKEQKVVGNGGVKIDSTMGTMQGAAFVADTAMKTITIKDSAKGL
ncbi:MAG: LPS export ABC transporter periplasmic protein LptC [Armatimonadota bacterium]|nr:LPS export ABC transporter periplasmic protein LptC [bacterium]